MPGKIKVKILAGRNLPVMDRSGDTTDAYVEIKFGNTTYKTDVCRKSLNPQWNSEWYRFEVDDAELQDEPLQVRLMDHDTYSANDAIGKVYVNLNPLLLPGLPPAVKNIWTLEASMNSSIGAQGGSVMTGWIPVFDTMHGIRGEVNIIVKVELFSDCNKFRQSSCGVQFFYSPNVPHGYHAQVIHGFVEELVVSDDPEYKWIDKIRTPRASNEARQTLFFKLSGEVQRKIGLKALDLGGNAVIGYIQNFDLEGESGIVARGIGTAVTLVKLQDITSMIPIEPSNIEDLTSFGLQSKNLYDLSESDDSLPLLSRSPNLTPLSRSPTNLHATIVSNRFPKHEKSSKYNNRNATRIAEYRASSMRSRQFSLQPSNSPSSNSQSPLRKGAISSLSLSDDLISESSLKNMLALEDMRGEPTGNPFSRGLKNFRYLHQSILPRRVAQIKSKITDSFDDESDPDTSAYSSTWSLAGSESNRSPSIVDIRQSIRRKKFTHKKTANNGIAALLIRSVHSGFPLDSVREDRETPTPSPVNFLSDSNEYADYSDEQMVTGIVKDNDLTNSNEESSSSRNDENYSENKILLGKGKHDIKFTSEILIPMMSSSETDTSTSDEDEPSESSTNYNILDDTYSIIDPGSPDERKFDSRNRRGPQFPDISDNVEKSVIKEKIEKKIVRENNPSIDNTIGDENLESSTDYNILDDNCSLVDNEVINDDSQFERNFQRVIEVAKLSMLTDAIDRAQSSKEMKNWKLRREDEIDLASSLQEDRFVKSKTDNDFFHGSYTMIDPSINNDDGLESELRRAMAAVDFTEIPATICDISRKREESTIDTSLDADRSSTSRSDENFESSTDYRILDESYPPFERESLNRDNTDHNDRPVIVSVILKKIEKPLEKSKELELQPDVTEDNPSHSRANSGLEDRTDFQFLDNVSAPINPRSSLDENIESSVAILQKPTDYQSGNSPITIPIEADRSNESQPEVNSRCRIDVEKNEQSSLIVEKTTDCDNFESSNEPKIDFPKVTDPSTSNALISSPSLEKSADYLEKIKSSEIEKTRDGNSPSTMLRDCHSTSSTNYNFLDDSNSPIEMSSIDDEKIELNSREAILTEIPGIPIDTDSVSLPIESDEKIIRIIDTEIESDINENLSSNEKLESSTDYNILDDNCSLNCAISLDDTESGSSIRRAIEIMKLPESNYEKDRKPNDERNSHYPEIPTTKNDESIQNLEDNAVNKIEENVITPPASLIPERRSFDYPDSKSKSPPSGSSPNSKLKHLKFLPKQKHFDSTEDGEFVTSTPVETDVVLFQDFEPKEKSFESTKSSMHITDFEILSISDRSLTDERSITKNLPTIMNKQICPLGITFEKTTIANDIKIGKSSKLQKINDTPDSPSAKPPNLSKVQETSESKITIIKKEKSQKKIERTDTVIYKGPPKDKSLMSTIGNRVSVSKTTKSLQKSIPASPIPIIVAPPPEEHATRLQVPIIQTTNINVQSTFSPDEMKTQQFGSIGSRKFPIDECAIGEKFSRKYRQHCMLDLIKTIDTKMMIHHAHHERRDSTKSKKKRRDRINTSATPSPDSIHRIKSHRGGSRSKSPDRQHIHNKNQVSPLTTHSYPNSGMSTLKNPFNQIQDSQSCDSSYENLSRQNVNPPIVVCSTEFDTVTKENTISPMSIDQRVDTTKNNISSIFESFADNENSLPIFDDLELKDITISVNNDNAICHLDLKDTEHPVFKSHSAGSLEKLRERFIVNTNNTNNSNTIDDLCVPCSPLILRQPDEQQQPSSPVPTNSALPSSLGSKVTPNSASSTTKTNTTIPNMHRRSSDSDLSITPKGNSLAGSDRSMGGHMRPSTAIVRTMNQDTMEMLEYPFITMQQYPAGFVLNIGGLVSARSVKLLERITNLEEPEGRDAWWTEIRMEVRSHARALACNVVLGYKEEISICDDVCVLNASGTAAVINLLNASQEQDNVMLSRTIMTTSVESTEREKPQAKSSNVKSDKSEESSLPGQGSHGGTGKVKRTSESNDHEIPYLPTLSACSLCHLPYSEASVPFRVDVSKCAICRRAKVPDVLFTTIELPENIPMTGRGVFLQATVCKCKRDLRGELNAKEISDCLPFLEYELHSLLLNKLKVKGMNAIFGLKVQVSVGERLVIGMAVGTAVYLTALPTPSVPKIASGNSWHNEEQLADIQKTLIETVKKNREFYRLKPITELENGRSITTSDTDESDDDLPDLDLGVGTKDACVLEVDDVEDMDRINLLMDERPPDDFHVVNTQTIPGLEDLEIVRNLQMFTQISRAKIPAGQFASMPSKYFARMLQTVLFKLRRMVPCALCDMQFRVALPEQDEIQLSVVGMALGLGEPTRFSKYKRKLIPNSASKDPVKKTDENDMIFSLDEDQADNTTSVLQETANNQNTVNPSNSSPLTGLSAQKHRPRSPFRTRTHVQHRHKHVPLKERYGVDITPLSYLPGGKIERYLGNLNFFFIRESTSIRENGGLSGFTHSFVTEILAIVRAHITALGGNAMVAFFMTQCVLLHSPHKNQGQSLINVGGDVVTVSYYGDDKYQGNQNC